MTHDSKPALASLTGLMILQVIMLGSLYAGIAPHPPAATPLFGIGPFLGASLAAAAAAMIFDPLGSKAGRSLAGLAAAMALVSFGPQKYFDAQFPLIWPAVIAGQVCAITVLASVLPRRSARGDTALA